MRAMWVIFQARTKQHDGWREKVQYCSTCISCLLGSALFNDDGNVDQWIYYCPSAAAATDHRQRLLGGGVVAHRRRLVPNVPMYRLIPVRPMENGDYDDDDGDESYAAAIE